MGVCLFVGEGVHVVGEGGVFVCMGGGGVCVGRGVCLCGREGRKWWFTLGVRDGRTVDTVRRRFALQ